MYPHGQPAGLLQDHVCELKIALLACEVSDVKGHLAHVQLQLCVLLVCGEASLDHVNCELAIRALVGTVAMVEAFEPLSATTPGLKRPQHGQQATSQSGTDSLHSVPLQCC